MTTTRTARILRWLPLLGALALVPLAGLLASSPQAPLQAPCGPADAAAASVPGGSIAAAHGDALLVTTPGGSQVSLGPLGGEGAVLRHVAHDPRHGIAFVVDRRGADRLLVLGPDGAVEEVSDEGEITHPAWAPDGRLAWSRDLREILVREPSGAVTSLGPPDGARGLFSPVFTAGGALVAIASEPVEGYAGEDDALNNLHRYEDTSGSWNALTAFEAGGDRWSVLRTPVAMSDGSIRVIRMAGSATAAGRPGNELWTVDEDGARRLRSYPPDTFLAGRLDGEPVLNVLDYETGEWRLALDTEAGRVDLGCGSVMTDPLVLPDPDVGPEGEGAFGVEGDVVLPTVSDGSLAIVVGDFRTKGAAARAADELAAEGDPRIVDHDEAPAVVAPDAWAVVIPLPEGTPVLESLDGLRERHPDLRKRTWVTAI